MSKNKHRSIGELRFRENLANAFLDALHNHPALKDDPRAPEAIKTYEKQLISIRKQINQYRPENITVGLQAGRLAGEVKPAG